MPREIIRTDTIHSKNEITLFGHKNKPKQLMKNKYTVQLIDALTGKIQEQMEAENMISSHHNLMSIQDQFFRPPFSNSTGRVPDVKGWNHIILTDWTGPEDTNLSYMKGDIIGYAWRDKSHAGLSIWEGTINDAECTKDGHFNVTLVFDWPTHAANGSFQSIFWYPAQTGIIDNYQYLPTGAKGTYIAQSVPNSPGSDGGTIHFDGDWMYYTKGGYVYRSKNTTVTSFQRSITDYVETLANLTATDNTLKGIGKSGDYWYVYGDQNDKIYKFDANWTLITSWSLSNTYLNSSYRPWIMFNDKIHTIKYNSATDYTLHRFALDGTLEKSTNLYRAAGGFYNWGGKGDTQIGLVADSTNLIVATTQAAPTNYTSYSQTKQILVVDPTTHNVISDMPATLEGEAYPYGFTWNPKLKMFEGPRHVSYPQLWPQSHIVLPSAITKNNTQLLKISYNITLDPTDLPTI